MIIVNVIKKKEVNGSKEAMVVYELARCETREEAEKCVAQDIDEFANAFYFAEQTWCEHTTLYFETDCLTYLTVYQHDFYEDEGSEEEERNTWLYQYRDTEYMKKDYERYTGFDEAAKAYRKEVK